MAKYNKFYKILSEVSVRLSKLSKNPKQLQEQFDNFIEALKDEYTLEHYHFSEAFKGCSSNKERVNACINYMLENVNTNINKDNTSDKISKYLKENNHMGIVSVQHYLKDDTFSAHGGNNGGDMGADYPKAWGSGPVKRVKPKSKKLLGNIKKEYKEYDNLIDVQIYCEDAFGKSHVIITDSKKITRMSENLINQGYSIKKVHKMSEKDYDNMLKNENDSSLNDFVSDILNQPRVDIKEEAPTIQNMNNQTYHNEPSCSSCNKPVPSYAGVITKFCPSCGANLVKITGVMKAPVQPTNTMDRKNETVTYGDLDDLINNASKVPDEVMLNRGNGAI